MLLQVTKEGFERGLLYDMGYRKDAGFKKGWYRMVYKENMRNLTNEELETKCLGVIFCGTDKNQILEDLKKEINELGI